MMKKRAMKKWIPYGPYCHDCKWWHYIRTIRIHRDSGCEFAGDCKKECWRTPETQCRHIVCRCDYENFTDREEETLLWDQCKICGVHDPDI